MRIVAVATLVLAACGSEDPRVTRASPAEDAAARETLDAFYAAIPDWDVRISSVRFGWTGGWADGYYDPRSRRIHLRPGDPDTVPTRLTHELCHALERQNPAAVDLDAPRWRLAWEGHEDHYGPGAEPGEAFAETCEIGAESAWIVGEACPDDTAGAGVYQALLDVYAPPASFLGAARRVDVRSVTVPGAGLGLDARGTTAGQVVFSADARVYVDPWTGDPAPFSPDAEREPADRARDPQGLVVGSRAVAGDQAILLVTAWAPNGGVALRSALVTADGVARGGCPYPGEQLFAAGGAVWSAWADGDVVTWARWEVP